MTGILRAQSATFEQDLAAGRFGHAVDHAQEGGFAGAAAAEKCGGGSWFEFEIDAVEQQPAAGEAVADVAKLDGTAAHGRLSIRGFAF